MPTISLTNSKLGSSIPSINLPPIITCRPNTPCAKGCYALKGNWRFANVKESLRKNLEEYQTTPDRYFKTIEIFLTNPLVNYSYFRFHSSGDIVDKEYFIRMVKLAKKVKHIKFLCFTKKFEIINEFLETNTIPKNLKIILSAWDRDFKFENPYHLPVTYVHFKNKEKNPNIPELSIPCTGHCPECLACWTLKNNQSVVFKQH